VGSLKTILEPMRRAEWRSRKRRAPERAGFGPLQIDIASEFFLRTSWSAAAMSLGYGSPGNVLLGLHNNQRSTDLFCCFAPRMRYPVDVQS
jgi:hypothetical protein